MPVSLLKILRSGWTLVGLSCGSGLALYVAIDQHLNQKIAQIEQGIEEPYPLVSRVVPIEPLQAGDVIRPEQLAVRDIPEEFVPAESTPPELVDNLIGQVAIVDIENGQPITPKTTEIPLPPRLSEDIPEGMRAVTISVDETNSIAGGIAPGDRIDVYVSRFDQSEGLANLLVRGITVLDVGRYDPSWEKSRSDYGTVTLLASEEIARNLMSHARAGSLSITLQSQRATENADVPFLPVVLPVSNTTPSIDWIVRSEGQKS